MRMLHFALALAVTSFCFAIPRAAAAKVRSVLLSADNVAYYSDRFLIVANGKVVARLSDGTTVAGNSFSMDLKLNRFLIAGGVTLTAGATRWAGAAFADFLDFDRAYFVPVLQEPDRWTFLGDDYAHPVKGREMPGDTFFLPDVGRERVFLYAKRAEIAPLESVHFTPARINTGIAFVPSPGYFLTFSTNPNFAQNSLAGAYFDAPYPIAGSRHSIETIHFRYDQINKGFIAYEQHFAGARSYAVASVNPLTRPQKQFNLKLFDRLSPKLQVQTFSQLFTFQRGFTQPLSAGQITNVQITTALRGSFLQTSTNFFNNSLLAPPKPDATGLLFYGDPSHNFVSGHPFDSQLTWNGFDRRLKGTPLSYRLRSGIAVAHNEVGVQSFGGVVYPTLWHHFLGGTVYTPSYRLGKATFFNGVYDRQREWFSSPHQIDSVSATVTLSRLFQQKAAGYVAYSVGNTRDVYGEAQLLAYPPTIPISPFDGRPHPEFASFAGSATTRSVSASLAVTPSPAFNYSLSLQANHDFPQPIPEYFGRPPYQATGSVRIRLDRNLSLSLSRSYYFNFGKQRWSPTFGIQFGP